MKIWFSAPIAPRNRAGASSDRYVGTVDDERPIPSPMISRESTSSVNVGENAAARVPTMTIAAATWIVRRRPRASLVRLENSAPTMAPTDRLAVITPLSQLVSAQSFPMNGSTPEITPRS